MAELTEHYQYSALTAGDDFSDNGYKFTDADRHKQDFLDWLGAEGHVHDGADGTAVEPDTAPSLELETTGGVIPASTRVFYKYTYVNSRGEETAASPEAFIDTPAALDSPSAPSLSYEDTGGVLQAGNYFYALSSYTDASIQETLAMNFNYISIPANTSTNVITLTLPDPEVGQTGFNVYRRAPGQSKYFFLDSIDTTGGPITEYVDDGSVEDNCDRTVPKTNTTNSTNLIVVSLPGATPSLPGTGYTWKIYRTYVQGMWTSSFLVHVVEETTEGSGVIVTFYDDIGISTQSGTYPATTLVTGSPSKIVLTDNAHVEGELPIGSHGFQHTFQQSGYLTETVQGSATFICEFPQVEIVYCRAALGRGSVPASSDVIVDINKGNAGSNPTYTTIFTTQANRPRVLVGEQVGDPTTPDVILLNRGDTLTMDIDQIGGGATPTDRDLVVTVWMIAYGYPEITYVDGESGGVGGEF